MFKQNESDIANINFELQAQKGYKLFGSALFC